MLLKILYSTPCFEYSNQPPLIFSKLYFQHSDFNGFAFRIKKSKCRISQYKKSWCTFVQSFSVVKINCFMISSHKISYAHEINIAATNIACLLPVIDDSFLTTTVRKHKMNLNLFTSFYLI